MRALGPSGEIGLVSFGESALLTAGEGGCILTADGELAAKLRTIRNFHPSETFAPVRLRINAKMSEAQAAFVRVGLERLDATLTANAERARAYAAGLAGLAHVRLHAGDEGDGATVILEVDDEVRSDRIAAALAAANVAYERPNLLAPGFTTCDRLARRLLAPPQASDVSLPDVRAICALVAGSAA